MNFIPVILALAPILLIFLLLTVGKRAADTAGWIGWAATCLVAWLFFQTPWQVLLLASLSGVVASLPVALVVATSIYQVTLMIETGAIARVVAALKAISPANQIAQIMIINIGVGTLLAALGSTPVSILPPIMLALGYSSFVAIALPAIGYDSLCTYALLGTPVVVFANVTGLSVEEAGGYFARFMPAVSTGIALGMLWLVGRWQMMWRGLLPALLTGLTAGLIAIVMNALRLVTLTGVAAGLGVVLVMFGYLKVTRHPLYDRTGLNETDLAAERRMSLLVATSPWLLLTLFSLVMNASFLPFFELVFKQWQMPVEIIPGAPEKLRLGWQAYTWILVSTLAALPILKPSRQQLRTSLKKWWRRAPRPVMAAAVFFAIAYVLNHSGKGLDWQLIDPDLNMVWVLADAAARFFGGMYPVAAPFLGLFGGFISGSEASSIVMLTKLHLTTAEKIGVNGLLVAAASGIGGGLASVISPAKLQNAAASIDRIGEEGRVIPAAFAVAVAITVVSALLTLLWVI